MNTNIKTESESSILALMGLIDSKAKSEDALRYTQAALNIAHTLQVLQQIDINNEKEIEKALARAQSQGFTVGVMNSTGGYWQDEDDINLKGG